MKKAILIFIISLCIIPNYSKATGVDTYTLLAPLPCISGVGNCSAGMQTEISLNDYIAYVYKFAIAISVFLAIIMIIWGGFLTVTSETPFKIEDGKKKIENAAIGLGMVFASYLILLTIDPRLVDIKTQLPPIISSADLNAMQAENRGFQKQLASNLIQNSNEALLKINDMNQAVTDKQKMKDELDAKIADTTGIGALKGQELVDAKTQSAKLGNDIINDKAEISSTIAKNAGAVGYAQALDILNNPNPDNSALSESGVNPIDAYTAKPIPNTTVNGVLPTNSPNIIQNVYNQEINDIYKTNTNYDKADILAKQRDFYIEQTQEDAKLHALIKTSDTPMQGTGEDTIMMDKSKELQVELDKYKKDIVSQEKQAASGLTPDEYKAIYQARIDTVSKSIRPPQKP